MKQLFLNYYRDYKSGFPFIILFFSSLFLSTAPHRIVFYLTVPFLIAMLWKRCDEVKEFVQTRTFAILSAYLGYFLLSFFWSTDTDAGSFLKLLRDVTAVMVFTLSMAVVIPHIKFSTRTPIYFAVVCSAFAIVVSIYFFVIAGADFDERLRGLGRYVNSIHLSFLLSHAILGLVCLGLATSKRNLAIRIGLILGLLIFIALTQTRSAYVSLAVCVGLMSLLGHARYAIVLLAISVVCAMGAYLCWDHAFSGIVGRMDSYRFDIWRDAIEGIREREWFGHGITTSPHFFPEAVDSKRGWKSTHNAFLGHAYTGGFVGLAIYIAMLANMIWIAFSRYVKSAKERICSCYMTMFACLTLCYALFASLFNFSHYIVGVHIQWLVFWTPFSIIWYMEVIGRREKISHA